MTVAAIKNGYILSGAANFHEKPVTAEKIAADIAAIRRRHGVFMVAGAGDGIAGFAAADGFRELAANRLAEWSIYLAPEATGQGIGRALLTAVIRRLREDGFYAGLMAVITADNEGSLRFHRRNGFDEAGYWRKAAWKFGRWHDIVVLEYLL